LFLAYILNYQTFTVVRPQSNKRSPWSDPNPQTFTVVRPQSPGPIPRWCTWFSGPTPAHK